MPIPDDPEREGPDDLHGDTRADTFSWTNPAEVRVPGLTILSHPDPGRIGEVAPLARLTAGQEEPVSRREPAFTEPWGTDLHPLGDPYLSRRPVLFTAGRKPGGLCIDCRDTTTRVRVDGDQVQGVREISPAELERGAVLLFASRVVLLLHYQEPFLPHTVPHFGLVGDSSVMVHLRQDVERVADITVPVLLRGETGTGKELVARAIHRAGPRRHGPFVAINMGAIPPPLAAAELFGAAKGAYTGADRKRSGYFSQAAGGTLFLDEIGETPPEVQVLLLRSLESGEIQPVGGTRRSEIDVRLIAATDADLEDAVKAERFRAPLLHRLSGYEIRLPTLRERRDDVGRLFVHFLREELEEIGEARRLDPPGENHRPWLSAGLVARLAVLDWPGNVRQLRNVARQLVIASRGARTLRTGPQVERLLEGSESGSQPSLTIDPSVRIEPGYLPPASITKERLREALRAHRFGLKATARELGISRTSLYDLLRRHGLRKAGDLGREEIEACRDRCDGDLIAMVEALEVSERGLVRRMKDLGLR